MQIIESTPPLRACAPIALALILAAAHVGRPLIAGTDALVGWRTILVVALLAPIVIAAIWLVGAESYVLGDESFEVRRAFGSSQLQTYSLSDLSSVGVSGGGLFGTAVFLIQFRGGAKIRVPRFYSQSGAQFRVLFSRLGANIAAKNAV